MLELIFLIGLGIVLGLGVLILLFIIIHTICVAIKEHLWRL